MNRFLARVAVAFALSVFASQPGFSWQPTESARSATDDGPHVMWVGGAANVYWSRGGGCAMTKFDKAPFDLPLVEIAPMTLRLEGGPYEVAESEYPEPPQIFVLSDVHGQFEHMRSLLIANKVVDDQCRWTFGKGHLVVLGDVADRGRQVTECYWFIRALEDRAKAAGGRVHMVLGNHEVMLMTGDFRSVNPKYLKRPDGMPDLAQQYGADSELGRWLRSRPLVLKIGDSVFAHGGISPGFIAKGLGLAAANAELRLGLSAKKGGQGQFLRDSSGPIWYRGMVLPGPADSISEPDLNRVLSFLKAKRVVVGHTTLPAVTSLHGGRVLVVDAGFQFGHAEGLLMAKGKLYRALADGTKVPL